MAIDKDYSIEILKRLFESENPCGQITLISGSDNQRIQIHRDVLTAASKYFEMQLESHSQDGNHNGFTLDDIDGATLKMIVDYCYTGHISLTADNVGIIVAIASSVELDLLVEKCRQFYNEKLSVSSSVYTFIVADKYSFVELRQRALNVICEGFEPTPLEGFQELTPKLLEEVLQCDQIQASEEFIFMHLLSWYTYAKIERREQMPRLLKWIRLQHITSKFLDEKVTLLYKHFHCSELVTSERERRASNQEMNTVSHKRFQTIWCVREFIENDISPECKVIVSKYISSLNRFTPLRVFKVPNKTDFGIIFHRSRIYLLGGKEDSACTNFVESRVFISNEATILPRMNVARERFASILCGKYIYVFGGFTDSGISDSCERFNIETNSWHTIKSMKVARYWSSAAVLNGYIYVAGGVVRSQRGNGFADTETVEMYDPICDEWVQVASLEIACHNCTLISTDGFLFASAKYYAAIFDPAENEWDVINMDELDYRILTGIGGDGEMSVILSNKEFGGARIIENQLFFGAKTEEDPSMLGRISLFRD